MPIRVLTVELVQEIIESYGQIRKLNLSTNEIERVENLECLTCLTKLNLLGNRLGPAPDSLCGLARLTCLRELDLSDNSITSLQQLSLASVSLEKVNVANNAIEEVDEVKFLAPLVALTDLVFIGNPAARRADYRQRVQALLPVLQYLDRGLLEREDPFPMDLHVFQAAGVQRDPGLTASEGPSPSLPVSINQEIHLAQRPIDESRNDERLSAGANDTAEQLDLAGARGQADPREGCLPESTPSRSDTSDDAGDPSEISPGTEGGGSTPASESKITRGSAMRESVSGDEDIVTNEHGCLGMQALKVLPELTHHAEGGADAPPLSHADPGRALPTEQTLASRKASVAAVVVSPASGVTGGALDCASEGLDGGTQGNSYMGPEASIPIVGRVKDPSRTETLDPTALTGTLSLDPFSRDRADANHERVKTRIKTEEVEQVQSLAYTPVFPSESPATEVHVSRSLLGESSNFLEVEHSDFDKHCMSSRGEGDARIQRHGVPVVGNPGQDASRSLRYPGFGGAERVTGPTSHSRPQYMSGGLDRVIDSGHGKLEEPTFPSFSSSTKADVGSVLVESNSVTASKPNPLCTKDHRTLSVVKGHGQHIPMWHAQEGTFHPQHASEESLVRSSLPWDGEAAKNILCSSSRPTAVRPGWQGSLGRMPSGAGQRSHVPGDVGDDLQVVMVPRHEWELMKRDKDNLRLQLELAQKRCEALSKMQQLADRQLAREHASRFGPREARRPVTAGGAGGKHLNPKEIYKEGGSSGETHQDIPDEDRISPEDEESGVVRLLGLWRSEVLKLLLQQGQAAEVAAEESRKAARGVDEERKARTRAEDTVKGLEQHALAAEAEAELANVKLERALGDLRESRNGWRTAKDFSLGHATAVRELHEWVQEFVGRASDGFHEKEALLARSFSKLEAFSQRVVLATERLGVVRTLLQRKEVQLRNSRAALVADRRIWLFERKQRERAALAHSKLGSSASSYQGERTASAIHQSTSQHVADKGSHPADLMEEGGACRGDSGVEPAISPPLLDGLRPECEAVMRALFCRVDRLGTGAVRARRLLSVLRSDCGVSQLMEAAVGVQRWRSALDSMEAHLSPPPSAAGLGLDEGIAPINESAQKDEQRVEERDITWGEFLLFFVPSSGSADDTYSTGLLRTVTSGPRATTNSLRRNSGAPAFGNVTEDAAALLQMVVPSQWMPTGAAAASTQASTPGFGAREYGQGLVALSVGQLQREVRRLGKERAYLLWLLKEDGRLGIRRAEAVHDQYRHELRALHSRVSDVETTLREATLRADRERDRATALREELSEAREEMERACRESQRRLDEASDEKATALKASSREASRAKSVAEERISRLEAEHALALRENGKASVRQRALERELARIKNSLETEAKLEKEALEERLRVGDVKLATARRERNALLAALRDIQRKGGAIEPHHGSSLSRSSVLLETPALQDGARGRVRVLKDARSTLTRTNSVGDAKATTETSSSGYGAYILEKQRPRQPERIRKCPTLETPAATEETVVPLIHRKTEREGGSEPAEREDKSKTAALAARLEQLALQTQRLLDEDSGDDTSCSGDGGDR